MRIAVIGSAGRGTDMYTLTRAKYLLCLAKLQELVADVATEELTLVSGGAAWMDHLAVTMYRRGLAPNLELHLPATWNSKLNRYNGERGTPGATANYYHKAFSKKMSTDTLASLGLVIKSNPSVYYYKGFKERNLEVAKVDRMIAFTYNQGEPKPGSGTLHTWNNSKAKEKIHVNLATL